MPFSYYDEFTKLAGHNRSRDVHLNCDVRRMYAIMFYELKEFDVLEHHLQSFKSYLIRHRGKLSYHFQNWNRFIRMISKLVRVAGNRERLSKLASEIRGMEYLSSKDWFIEQLTSLPK